MRLERDRRHADAIMKRPCLGDKDNVPDMKYASLLTPYAYKIVVKQMQLSEKVNIDSSEDKVTLIISSGETTVTATSCSCGFVLLYLLPCRHVLAMRKKLGLDVYFTDLVHETWCLAKYNDNSKISLVTPTRVSDDKSSSAPVSIPVSVMQRREVLTQSQKYKTAFVKAQKLAELASEFSMLEYNKRLAILAKLVSCWEQDQDVEVVNFSEEVQGDNDEISRATTVALSDVQEVRGDDAAMTNDSAIKDSVELERDIEESDQDMEVPDQSVEG
ncbi:uncharacterized protein [Dysidea avara]|uniref:uncharacterized protein n=1 Tax=Dysidea avara TaxID=196820 RepID=UPI0033184029